MFALYSSIPGLQESATEKAEINPLMDVLRTEALFLRLWPGELFRSASTFLPFLSSGLNRFPPQQTSQGSWYSISTDVFNLVYPENTILSRNQGHLRGPGYAF